MPDRYLPPLVQEAMALAERMDFALSSILHTGRLPRLLAGLLLLDDRTPAEDWPPEWRGRPDPTRDFWLHDPRSTRSSCA